MLNTIAYNIYKYNINTIAGLFSMIEAELVYTFLNLKWDRYTFDICLKREREF